MRTKILLLTILIGIISINKFNAQQCGTPQTTNYPENQRTVTNSSYNDSFEPICFNVYYHIVRESNGSGGFNSSLLNEVTDKLNDAFNPHLLYVNNLGFDYINNSTYYNIDDTGNNNTEFNALVQINNRPDAINIYIVNNAVSYAGRANGILSQALVIESSWANTQVLSHEVGHCLDLWHTFQGTAANTSGCAEAINGSNCTTCGDYVCDTPADANTGNSGGFTPDMDNIMSYYYPFNHFSDEQIVRSRNAFASSSLLQQVVGTTCLVPEINGSETICNSSGTTYNLSNGGNSVSWNVSSNLTILSQNQNSITVKPTSTSTNGAGFVEAILTTQTLRKDIWIGKPQIATVSYTTPSGPGSNPNYICVYLDLIGANNTSIVNQGITSVNWSKVYSSGQCNPGFSGNSFNGNACGSCDNWIVQVKITATNSCGQTTIYRNLAPPRKEPSSSSYRISSTSKNVYEIVQITELSDNNILSNQESSQEEKNVSILVFNHYGIKVLESAKSRIDISHLENGIYIIHASINHKTLTSKIIKQ